jgi:ATP-dependent phosphoenolpyruvate carboxykinase
MFRRCLLTLHPTEYATLLGKKLEEHGTKAYLVNTGWSGGAYGTGSRMKIKQTRACIDAILDGSVENAEFVKHPVFQFEVPQTLGGVPADVLNVVDTWPDRAEYDATVQKLADKFKANFKQYATGDVVDYTSHGPK